MSEVESHTKHKKITTKKICRFIFEIAIMFGLVELLVWLLPVIGVIAIATIAFAIPLIFIIHILRIIFFSI